MSSHTNNELFDPIAVETWQKYFGDSAFVTRAGMRPLIAREYCSELTALIHQHTEQAVREARLDEAMIAFNMYSLDTDTDESELIAIRDDRIAQLTTNHKGDES